eukprot:6181371-Pleurochrysis_carterae.AAC.4
MRGTVRVLRTELDRETQVHAREGLARFDAELRGCLPGKSASTACAALPRQAVGRVRQMAER